MWVDAPQATIQPYFFLPRILPSQLVAILFRAHTSHIQSTTNTLFKIAQPSVPKDKKNMMSTNPVYESVPASLHPTIKPQSKGKKWRFVFSGVTMFLVIGSVWWRWHDVFKSSESLGRTPQTELVKILSSTPIKNESASSDNLQYSSCISSMTVIDGVKFIPFPHKVLESGLDVACDWSTQANISAACNPRADLIQRAAFTEGVCLPGGRSSKLHIFSTAEAIGCLSPTIQNRNISVIITGDSYNMQLFIGLTDILLGRPSNIQIIGKGGSRREKLKEDMRQLESYHKNDPSFPNVKWMCGMECFGDRKGFIPFSEHCSSCMNAYTSKSENVAAIVGAGVHVFQAVGGGKQNINLTIVEMKKYLALANRTIFNSMPTYQTEKTPVKYRNATHHHHTKHSDLFQALMPNLAPYNTSRPFIDFSELTKSCFMDNCSYDGGHRSRFVNRFKAQLLLNTICDFRIL
jgi:hypothetical protein